MTGFSVYASGIDSGVTNSGSPKLEAENQSHSLARQIGFGLFSIASAIGALGVAWLILNFDLSWQMPTAIGVAIGLVLLFAFGIVEFEPIASSSDKSLVSQETFNVSEGVGTTYLDAEIEFLGVSTGKAPDVERKIKRPKA